jgi:hypothetical protein
MALSGSTDFSLTAQSLIKHALKEINVFGVGETLDAEEFNDAKETLNMLLRSWQHSMRFAWLVKDATLFLVSGQQSYDLYSTGDHCTDSLTETALAADVDSGAASITVDSITGITDGGYIGIRLDDGSIQWTTVDGSPSGVTVTLDDALTDDASEDAAVYFYTTRLAVPERILNARYDDDTSETPLTEYDQRQYETLIQSKDSTGCPTIYWPKRNIDRMTVYVWPVDTETTGKLIMSVLTTINDIDNVNDSLHLPVHWYRALKYSLAVELSPGYGRDPSRLLLAMAESALMDAKTTQIGDGSIEPVFR